MGLICLALSLSPTHDGLPPEVICASAYQIAERHHCELCRAFAITGGWRLQQERDQAARWRDLWWAAWWVTWAKVTPDQRESWLAVYLERLAAWQSD